MSLIIIASLSLLGIFAGKFLFRKWINHLTLYCVLMGGLIFLYELKLIHYFDIVPLTWFYIISSSLSFFFGILTVISAKKLNSREQGFIKKTTIKPDIFADGGKALKYSIIFFSFIALFVALQRWYILIGKFGSITNVLINAAMVYRLNVQGEFKEAIPILPSFVYMAIFLLGIYTAYKRRFSLLTFFPFIAIVLKELTYFGRTEILFTLMEFFFSFFLFRHLLNNESPKRFKFNRKNAIIASTLLFVLLVSATSFVRISRGNVENYVGTSPELKKMKDNLIVSPSVYFYLSSSIGVFNKYIQLERDQTKFGESTFAIFYFFLAKLDLVEKPGYYQKGYYIPMWSNNGTYIRELHVDFGVTGVLLGPFLLGLLITWLWFKFYEEKNLYAFMLLVYLYVVVGFTFLMIVTRLNLWYISQFFILIYLPILEKLALNGKNRNLVKNT